MNYQAFEQENARLTEALEITQDRLSRLANELKAAQARIAELERDKARLDRLEGNIKSAGTDSVTTIRASDAESFNLRELIDGMRSRLAKDENNGTNPGK